MRFVRPRTLEQTDLLQLHKVVDRKIRARTALTNQIRGLLNEYGVVLSQGRDKLYRALPEVLEDATNGLTPAARLLVSELLEEWRQLHQTIQRLEKQIKVYAATHESATRLMAIKGIAEKTATALLAYAGDGRSYCNGRNFAANLGLVPKEHSSGGKQQLGGITRRGNGYIRRLLVQGAWSILRYCDRSDDRLSRWARSLVERRGKHKAVVAVANKLARIAWSMLYHQTEYRSV